MLSSYDARRHGRAVLVWAALMPRAIDAIAGDCDYIAKLRAESATNFQSMRMPSKDSFAVPSAFQLPGTNLCEIEVNATEYRCVWYLGSSASPQGEANAKKSLESLLATVQPCLAPTQELVRTPRRGGGEVIYLADPVANDTPRVVREIELSYDRDGRHWTLSFVYRYSKD
ncbi:hypothetical protein [Pseudoduganella sp. R-34]|uniref:hypothetical protein n=1 Tax=Pseudoduganella sp. R-34 TaxID=3404062 RepID=UPI003CEE66A7